MGGSFQHLIARLHEPERYAAELDKHIDKRRHGKRHSDLYQGELPASAVSHEGRELGALIATAVARQKYAVSPAEVRMIMLDKERRLVRLSLTDSLLHGVINQLLDGWSEPLLSQNVHSYRVGRSRMDALSAFAAYVRAHRERLPDPKARGLFVLRRDVRAYSDSVPVDPTSPLWPMLQPLLKELPPYHAQLVRDVIAPPILLADGSHARGTVGLPTGSPVAVSMLNFYLSPLDAALEALGGFYARYGDDFLFAHEDADVVARAQSAMDETLGALRLTINADKARDLFFNGAARACVARPHFVGVDHVDFLGCRVRFDGAIGITPKKMREVIDDVRERVLAVSALRVGTPLERAKLTSAAVARALDTSSPLAITQLAILTRAITDRAQLSQLDYHIAKTVSEAATGLTGARTFRALSYRTLRQECGLPSLVRMRERGPE